MPAENIILKVGTISARFVSGRYRGGPFVEEFEIWGELANDASVLTGLLSNTANPSTAYYTFEVSFNVRYDARLVPGKAVRYNGDDYRITRLTTLSRLRYQRITMARTVSASDGALNP